MKVLEYGCVFAAGGLGYGGLELLWRGRTHWSMLLCGGVCAVLIYLIAGRERTVLWRRWQRFQCQCALARKRLSS